DVGEAAVRELDHRVGLERVVEEAVGVGAALAAERVAAGPAVEQVVAVAVPVAVGRPGLEARPGVAPEGVGSSVAQERVVAVLRLVVVVRVALEVVVAWAADDVVVARLVAVPVAVAGVV